MKRLQFGTRALPMPLTVGAFVLIVSLFAVGLAVAIAQSNSQLPPQKQAILDKSAADGATAVANRKPGMLATGVAHSTEVAIKLQTPQPTPTIITGIQDIQLSPFNSEEALVENRWQGFIGGQFVRVYAGRLTADSEQGFVAIERGLADSGKGYLIQPSASAVLVAPDGTPIAAGDISSHTLQKYLTPRKGGTVRIVSVDGLRLTLTSKSGKTFIFDLGSLTFK